MKDNAILKALKKRYEANISEADAVIVQTLYTGVAVGTHTQALIEDIDKNLQKKADNKEKINSLLDIEKLLADVQTK